MGAPTVGGEHGGVHDEATHIPKARLYSHAHEQTHAVVNPSDLLNREVGAVGTNPKPELPATHPEDRENPLGSPHPRWGVGLPGLRPPTHF